MLSNIDAAKAARSARAVLRSDLVGFTLATKPDYQPASFHWDIAKRFESIYDGPQRLMFFVPPRHGKSELVSVRGPAQYLGLFPDREIIHASYAAELSNHFSRQARNLLRTPEYQAIFPGIAPARDSAAVDSWHLEGKRGGFYSVGVGGPVTGKGAHLIDIDDPVKNAQEARSDVTRQRVKDWYRQDIRTRLMPGGSIVLTMTRWHMDDLAGWILEEEKNSKGSSAFPWQVYVLPCHDPARGWLWPERYSHDEYEEMKFVAGKYGWAALFQQNPLALGGGMLERTWFNQIPIGDAPRKMVKTVMGVDLAVTKKTSADYTVGLPVSVDKEGRIYFWPPYREQAEWPDAKNSLINRARVRKCSMIGVESVAFQKAAAQTLRREHRMAGISIVEAPVDEDKVSRVADWNPIAKSGQIWLVDDGSGWVDTFLKECEDFPLGKNDDQVDAAGIALATLRRKGEQEVKRRGS